MDRKSLKRPFTLEGSPDWECPTCKKGTLKIDPKKFHQGELSRSRGHGHEAWSPDWIEYVYSALLTCTNSACKEVVATSGIGSVDQEYSYDENGEIEHNYYDYFRPKYFEPPLQIMKWPEDTPPSVSILLEESFRHFFSAPNSALNQIRIAMEQLLTELGVKRFSTIQGKRRELSLHARIGLLPPKYASSKEILLAVKWLGNAGSHVAGENAEATTDDVIDAYEFLDHVLQELYKTKKVEALKKKAKQVNKKKGLVKK